MKQQISLVVTDLDDTIWDWLSMWYNSFFPYLENINKKTGIENKQLILDFKKLHRKYGTSECSYAYKELKSIKSKHVKIIENETKTPSIIHQYYTNKRDYLKMYDGVYDTLLQIKAMGVKIVGFTESNIFYTKYRIKTLGLDGIFDCIYTTVDHKIPKTVKLYYPKNHWNSIFTQFKLLPKGTKKPDPSILLSIINEMNGKIDNTIYIGDKLDRDIYMANLAKVKSVYAQYGHIIDNDAYELLKKVTHWSDSDVKREIEFKNNISNVEISADFKIKSFKEILKLFKFIEFENQNSNISDDDKKNKIEIWKNIISVQMHFNDIVCDSHRSFQSS